MFSVSKEKASMSVFNNPILSETLQSFKSDIKKQPPKEYEFESVFNPVKYDESMFLKE